MEEYTRKQERKVVALGPPIPIVCGGDPLTLTHLPTIVCGLPINERS